MRLHGLIFAAGQGIPLVGVVYDPKVSAFLSYMGQDLYEDLADVSADSLSAKLEQALAQRNDRAVLEAAVAHLRAIEQNTPPPCSSCCSKTKRYRSPGDNVIWLPAPFFVRRFPCISILSLKSLRKTFPWYSGFLPGI